MDAFLYERIFVRIIAEIAEKRGIPDARLAKCAWPHQKAAATAWRKMRNDNENPKRLNIEEAVLLTQFLGVSMADVCGMVQGRLMELENCSIPVSPQENQTQAKQAMSRSGAPLPADIAKV